MTYEQAQAKAKETGGTIGWTSARGHYVIAPAKVETAYQEAQRKAPEYVAPTERKPTTQEAYSPAVRPSKMATLLAGGPEAASWWQPQQWFPPVGTTPAQALAGGEYALQRQPQVGLPTEQQTAEDAMTQLLGGMPTRWSTISEGGWDYQVGYDKDGNIVSMDPLGRTQEAGQYPSYPQPAGEAPTDPYGRTATWDVDNAEWRYPPNWGVDPQTQQAGYVSPGEQRQEDYQQQQLAQQQAMQRQMIDWYREQQQGQLGLQKQQYLAQLAGQPKSWLEYAAMAGTEPEIQPWMLPLMPQQYSQLQAGATIPGWTGTQQAGQPMTTLPQLTPPSTQYMARLSPAARQQYAGYKQARTGAPASDVDWRLWSQAPPSGSFGGFRQVR